MHLPPSTNTHRYLHEMFKPGTILNDTWEVKRRIGQGSFCELFLAHNIVDKNAPLVAVKAQNDGIEASIIRVTISVSSTDSIIKLLEEIVDWLITATGRSSYNQAFTTEPCFCHIVACRSREM